MIQKTMIDILLHTINMTRSQKLFPIYVLVALSEFLGRTCYGHRKTRAALVVNYMFTRCLASALAVCEFPILLTTVYAWQQI